MTRTPTLRLCLALSLTACAAGLMSGCRHKESEGPEGVKMGLMLADATTPYGQAVVKGAQEVAGKRKFELIVKDAHGSAQAQATDLESLTTAGVSVVMIQPIKPDTLKSAAKKASDAKIYLVSLERKIPDADVSTHVEFNPELAGQLAADYFGSHLKAGGKVAVLKGAGTPGEAERLKAFRDYLKDKYPSVQLVGEESAADANSAKAAAGKIHGAHADLNGIYADSDAFGMAAADALRSASGAMVVCYGGGQEAVNAVKSGNSPLQMTLAMVPVHLGVISARSGWSIVSNKPAPSHAGLVVFPVTKENAGQFKGWGEDLPKNPEIPWQSELHLEGKRE